MAKDTAVEPSHRGGRTASAAFSAVRIAHAVPQFLIGEMRTTAGPTFEAGYKDRNLLTVNYVYNILAYDIIKSLRWWLAHSKYSINITSHFIRRVAD